MPTSEIRELTNHFVEQLLPVRIYLFGSFADSTYTEESDLDFYIIVHDAVSDIPAETTKAYKSIRKVKLCKGKSRNMFTGWTSSGKICHGKQI